MIIDCVVYVSSIANPKRHPRKVACLESFAQGVRHTGHDVKIEWSHQYTPARLAVILGWATVETRGGQNIVLRKQIIEQQQQQGHHVMCVDASCFKHIDHAGTYLRYSLGGPYYDVSEYANHDSDGDKWTEISQQLGTKLDPVQSNTHGHILICMQRDGGFAMKTLDPLQWVAKKIKQIRSVSNRPIQIRPHPGAYRLCDFDQVSQQPGVKIVDPKHSTLTQDLTHAHSVVLFNSSASVAAVCAGIPVFADNTSCVAWPVANTDIANIESPVLIDRTQWIHDLAAAHWSDQDGQTGRIWQKFLPYLRATNP